MVVLGQRHRLVAGGRRRPRDREHVRGVGEGLPLGLLAVAALHHDPPAEVVPGEGEGEVVLQRGRAEVQGHRGPLPAHERAVADQGPAQLRARVVLHPLQEVRDLPARVVEDPQVAEVGRGPARRRRGPGSTPRARAPGLQVALHGGARGAARTRGPGRPGRRRSGPTCHWAAGPGAPGSAGSGRRPPGAGGPGPGTRASGRAARTGPGPRPRPSPRSARRGRTPSRTARGSARTGPADRSAVANTVQRTETASPPARRAAWAASASMRASARTACCRNVSRVSPVSRANSITRATTGQDRPQLPVRREPRRRRPPGRPAAPRPGRG